MCSGLTRIWKFKAHWIKTMILSYRGKYKYPIKLHLKKCLILCGIKTCRKWEIIQILITFFLYFFKFISNLKYNTMRLIWKQIWNKSGRFSSISSLMFHREPITYTCYCFQVSDSKFLNNMFSGFSHGSVEKNPPTNSGDKSSIPGPGRSHIYQRS